MKSHNFKEANIQLGETQEQYETLSVYIDRSDPETPFTSCMVFSEDELAEVNRTGVLWLTQLTMSNHFHPIRLETTCPEGFEEVVLVGPRPVNVITKELVQNLKVSDRSEMTLAEFKTKLNEIRLPGEGSRNILIQELYDEVCGT